jgi:hypothetical protein
MGVIDLPAALLALPSLANRLLWAQIDRKVVWRFAFLQPAVVIFGGLP